VATRKGKPPQRTPAEQQAYQEGRARGFEEGRRAGIKFEQERRDDGGRLLRLPEVLRLAGISRATLWRLEREGLFPRRVQIAANIVGWSERAVLTWKADLPSAEEKDLSPEDQERRLRGEVAVFRIPSRSAARRHGYRPD
jgi:prophage regulatory protein